MVEIEKKGKIGAYEMINIVDKKNNLDVIVKYKEMKDIEEAAKTLILSNMTSQYSNKIKEHINK
jgi:hypothetical protein